MLQLEAASLSDLTTMTEWFSSADQVRNWAGAQVSFPLNDNQLIQEIDWPDAYSFRLGTIDELVAFGQLLPRPNRRLHLARLVVNPSYRGKGFGRQLSKAIIEEAISRRPDAVSLNVYRANEPAYNLYKRVGFVTAARDSGDAPPDAEYMDYMVYRCRVPCD